MCILNISLARKKHKEKKIGTSCSLSLVFRSEDISWKIRLILGLKNGKWPIFDSSDLRFLINPLIKRKTLIEFHLFDYEIIMYSLMPLLHILMFVRDTRKPSKQPLSQPWIIAMFNTVAGVCSVPETCSSIPHPLTVNCFPTFWSKKFKKMSNKFTQNLCWFEVKHKSDFQSKPGK